MDVDTFAKLVSRGCDGVIRPKRIMCLSFWMVFRLVVTAKGLPVAFFLEFNEAEELLGSPTEQKIRLDQMNRSKQAFKLDTAPPRENRGSGRQKTCGVAVSHDGRCQH